jgi:glycosyltransferase involved in cell wall biosynthesis
MEWRIQGRISFFLPDLTGGGAERVMLNLVNGFAALGHDCDLVLVRARGEYLAQVSPPVRIVDLAAGRALTSLPALVGYLRRERPAALLAALGHTNIIALLAARLAQAGTRVLVSEHGSYDSTRLTGAMSVALPVLIRRLYPAAHGVVAVSGGVADVFSVATRFPRERIQVIHNPVITPGLQALAAEDPAFLRTADARPFILGVGRLNPLKNFSLLISAFAQVKERHDVRLVILGEGEERALLERLVTRLGLRLGEDVLLPGFVSNPYAYMQRCSVFVLSSDSEGLPTVLIEALACRARVVSTDCPSGPREILREGRLGTLVPVGDVQALADAIGRALSGQGPEAADAELLEYTQEVAVRNYLQVLAA